MFKMQICPFHSIPFLQDSSTEIHVKHLPHSTSLSIRDFYHSARDLAADFMWYMLSFINLFRAPLCTRCCIRRLDHSICFHVAYGLFLKGFNNTYMSDYNIKHSNLGSLYNRDYTKIEGKLMVLTSWGKLLSTLTLNFFLRVLSI